MPVDQMNTQNARAFKENCLDAIRLVAAFQVLLVHMNEHLTLPAGISTAIEASSIFPGVPVFFFISGLVISRSAKVAKGILPWARNRILRILPGLLVCNVFSMAVINCSGYLPPELNSIGFALLYVLTASTILQPINFEIFRGYGTGVVNGSLWTIAVEIQFYVCAAVLAFRVPKRHLSIVFVIMAISLMANRALFVFKSPEDGILEKILGVTFVPWIYMFLIGWVFECQFEKLASIAKRYLFCIFGFYLAWVALLKICGIPVGGNSVDPVSVFFLGFIVVGVGYRFPCFAKPLCGIDLSYGIYLYHMPLINTILYFGMQGNAASLLVVCLTVGFAICSWFLVERPMLAKKQTSALVAKVRSKRDRVNRQ